jgi:hypothetical protein
MNVWVSVRKAANRMRLTSTAALMVTACALVFPPRLAATRAHPTRRTEVIRFRPSLPSNTKAAQGGRCWTESIAVNRPGAWRCMHVNMIYDPCFEVTGRKKQVVCGANPIKHDNGFALMLVQPLPPQRSVTAAPQPWLIELADGSVCHAATGTMSVISDEPVRYSCSASASEESLTPRVYCGLLGTLHRAKVWTADKVCFTVAPSDGGPPFKLLKREAVIVQRLWE